MTISEQKSTVKAFAIYQSNYSYSSSALFKCMYVAGDLENGLTRDQYFVVGFGKSSSSGFQMSTNFVDSGLRWRSNTITISLSSSATLVSSQSYIFCLITVD